MSSSRWRLVRAGCALAGALVLAGAGRDRPGGQRARGDNPFPGGTNADGSLRPSPPVTHLFTQDAYTEYALLEPGSESFRIRFMPEETRVGATELVNATRGGSEGSDIEVYDPRTGQPLTFTYEQDRNDPQTHAIHAKLPMPVPEGGIGRVLIYKTYKDPRTYMMHGDDLVWVRSLSGYRLGVLLPKGFAFISSNVAAQLSTTADGRLKLAFANPSGQPNPVTIHARRTTASFTPTVYDDMFFDDIRTLYDLDAGGRVNVDLVYSDHRKGDHARLDALSYLPMRNLNVIDLDTGQPLVVDRERSASGGRTVRLGVPIVEERQSAHIRITGRLEAPTHPIGGDLLFDRTLHGLRNTVLLPAGWEVTAVSQSGTIGSYEGRSFVALINLNAENSFKVTIRARRQK